MLINKDTTTRSRIIQEKAYEANGISNHSFSIPQPFIPSMFEHLREPLGIDPAGLAKQANQVFAENLANNMASRIKKIAAAIVAGAEDLVLPTQADMDELVVAYDFTGVRVGGATAFGSPFDKIFFRVSSTFIRKLLKNSGYQDQPAPVTVAKKTAEELTEGQISYEDFEAEVTRLVEGEGPWADQEAFVNLRDTLKEDAKAEEERLRNAEQETEAKLASISLGSDD